MAHDIVIRGGHIVDGNGREPYRGDLAIGALATGMRADVNVFDAEKVAERQPELVHDFPGGAPRFIQRSIGYAATLVNGQVSLLNGEPTGARAGTVLRHGR